MKRFEMAAAGSLSAVIMLTGCSGEAPSQKESAVTASVAASTSTQAAETQGPTGRPTGTCKPTGEWSGVPTNLKAGAVAEAIGGGITADQVKNGVAGQAHCTPGATAEQLNLQAPATIYTVEGIGSSCLALMVPEVPQSGKSYPDLGLICAVPNAHIVPTNIAPVV
jgi:hypothetical protein